MAPFVALIVLLVGVCASIALGVGVAYGLYVWTKKRWVWALTPLFVLFFMSCGALPLVGFAVTAPTMMRAAPPPTITPAPPIPDEPPVVVPSVQDAEVEPEADVTPAPPAERSL